MIVVKKLNLEEILAFIKEARVARTRYGVLTWSNSMVSEHSFERRFFVRVHPNIVLRETSKLTKFTGFSLIRGGQKLTDCLKLSRVGVAETINR